MSIRKLMVALPFALGIACSHSSSSKAHTGAMWTEQPGDVSDGGPQASAEAANAQSPDAQAAQVRTTSGTVVAQSGSGQDQGGAGSSSSGSSMGSSGGSSAGSSSGTSEGSDKGSSGSGSPMGSGGSSESMGTDQSATGGSASGSSDMGAATAHEMDKHVSGKLTKVSSDEITIAPKKGAPVTLQISDQTTVTMNGKSSDHSQLKQGQSVKASYQEAGTQEVAVSIAVSSSKQQGHHAKSTSGNHMQGGTGGSSGSTGSGSSGSSSGTSQ